MRARLTIGVLCVLATGCAGDLTTGSTASPDNPYPADYRKLAIDYIRTSFRDPYSIRDAQIAAPKLALGPSLLDNGVLATPWLICVRANAKNAFGAYTGMQVTAIKVYQGQAVGAWDNVGNIGLFAPCGGVRYEPLPEVVASARS